MWGFLFLDDVLTETANFWARIADLYYQCSVRFFLFLGFFCDSNSLLLLSPPLHIRRFNVLPFYLIFFSIYTLLYQSINLLVW